MHSNPSLRERYISAVGSIIYASTGFRTAAAKYDSRQLSIRYICTTWNYMYSLTLTCTHISEMLHILNPSIQNLTILIPCQNISSKERLQLIFAYLVGIHDITQVGLLVLISKVKELVYWFWTVSMMYFNPPPLLHTWQPGMSKLNFFSIRPLVV
jgi:hypothetical protein